MSSVDFQWAAAHELRRVIRSGKYTGSTAGLARGFVQANLVVLPGRLAEEFRDFCAANPKPCPLLEYTEPGCFEVRQTAPGSDLRTDLPRYKVFVDGVSQSAEPTDVRRIWRDDLTGFLLGCSFTFDDALLEAGLPVRHVEEKRNVPMFRTSLACRSIGHFAGPLVVSMRPFKKEMIDQVVEISRRFQNSHGEPIHVGHPQRIGISDLTRPDFGDSVTIGQDEIPVFWACGVTPQLVLENAVCDLAITHSPGCMFVTDLKWKDMCLDEKAPRRRLV